MIDTSTGSQKDLRQVQYLGMQDHYAGRVEVTEESPTRIVGRWKSSKTKIFQTTLEQGWNELIYSCTCDPFIKEGKLCRHVVATVHAAQKPSSMGVDFARDSELPWRPDIDRLAASNPAVESLRQAQHAQWKQALSRLSQVVDRSETAHLWPADREVLYIIDQAATMQGKGTLLEICWRSRKRDGNWSKPQRVSMERSTIPALPREEDRALLSMLRGAQTAQEYGYYQETILSARVLLSEALQAAVLPLACKTGRCYLRQSHGNDELIPLQWDEGGAWQFRLNVMRQEESGRYLLEGSLHRGEQRMALSEPVMLTAGGAVFTRDAAAPLDDAGAFQWIAMLRATRQLVVPLERGEELVEQMARVPRLPPVDLPAELQYEEVTVAPRPRLQIKKAERRGYWEAADQMTGVLGFRYGEREIKYLDSAAGVYDAGARQFIRRDRNAENVAAARLLALGMRWREPVELSIAAKQLPKLVSALIREEWLVEAEGKLYHPAGEIHIEVTSGIDWFDLSGKVSYGTETVALPQLLAALKRGESMVQLGDGTFGILPEEWLKKYGSLAGVGTAEGDALRFTRAQTGFLDALLLEQPEACCDEVFERTRRELREFAGVAAVDPPDTFRGELRPYQREAIGWFDFLRRFGFGGCLADDMGLGKTVQVLALLEDRRRQKIGKPSLVVVPRSLVFNWKQEAERFAPELRVLDQTGIERQRGIEHFSDYDLVLTTYGTLRRDAGYFKDVRFDYVILDEAQAVKNATTESAKAVRLLRGDHRLALSGTPIENHLGELWSMFDFLNPGMLGTATVFKKTTGSGKSIDEQGRRLLSRALRPFILRRTKSQVARDLPERLEQTIFCDLEPQQRKQYDELREYYRRKLLDTVAAEGMNKAKIQILEALLRLRQAACHPGLIDKTRSDERSAKLDVLMEHLAEVSEEGHKTLVFSQFTSLLAIVRKRLDEQGVVYEYLDGKTVNRQQNVERFQNDEDCRLFLISLKAGGLGLNLTRAEYVFLLDPWWNPAVEAQAIDRAHRIGQTRRVFAYRIIARDTVEEKVLQLQQTKRDLADAVINADNSLISGLGREDLELLLS
ncbi:MAG TPA: DEAD/DEAH box helicase [Tepidisphaeraceae bacterium]